MAVGTILHLQSDMPITIYISNFQFTSYIIENPQYHQQPSVRSIEMYYTELFNCLTPKLH